MDWLLVKIIFISTAQVLGGLLTLIIVGQLVYLFVKSYYGERVALLWLGIFVVVVFLIGWLV